MSVGILLSAQNLSKSFHNSVVLDNVSFSLLSGEVFGIIGPNGAGKTVLFNCLTGLLSIETGNLLFKGTSIKDLSLEDRNRLGISRTFQNIRLFRSMTVLENVMVGCASYALQDINFWSQFWRTSTVRYCEEEVRDRAYELLSFVGLDRYSDTKVINLPCGVQRSLEIAKAMSTHPMLLLLDEPAAGMNAMERRHLSQLIGKINASGISILLVEHDIKFLSELCERILVLSDGKVIAEGSPHAVCHDPEVMRVYLGYPTT